MALEVPTRAALLEFDPTLTAPPAQLDQALAQAALLYSVLAGVTVTPTQQPCADLYRNAVLDMARWLSLSQQWVAKAATPFASETIGSYSYTRNLRNTLLQGMNGKPETGVFWFDLAVGQCQAAGRSRVSSDAITVFEHDSVYRGPDGRRWVRSSAETAAGFAAPEVGASGVVSGSVGTLFDR